MHTSQKSEIFHYIKLENIQWMCEVSKDGPDFLKKLIRVFLKMGDAEIPKIQKAILEGDTKIIRFSAHSLKSSASHFGAKDLADQLASFEKIASEGSVPSEQEWDKLASAYTSVKNELEQVLLTLPS